MAALIIFSNRMPHGAARYVSFAVLWPGARRSAFALAAGIRQVAVLAGELALFCFAVIALALWVLVMAACFL